MYVRRWFRTFNGICGFFFYHFLYIWLLTKRMNRWRKMSSIWREQKKKKIDDTKSIQYAYNDSCNANTFNIIYTGISMGEQVFHSLDIFYFYSPMKNFFFPCFPSKSGLESVVTVQPIGIQTMYMYALSWFIDLFPFIVYCCFIFTSERTI